jgi:Kef-type K+ transport system membrane component KefB
MNNILRNLWDIFLGIVIPVIATIFITLSSVGIYKTSDYAILYVIPVLIKIWFVMILGRFIIAIRNRKKRPLPAKQTIFLSISFVCVVVCYFVNLFERELMTGKFHAN